MRERDIGVVDIVPPPGPAVPGRSPVLILIALGGVLHVHFTQNTSKIERLPFDGPGEPLAISTLVVQPGQHRPRSPEVRDPQVRSIRGGAGPVEHLIHQRG